MTRSIPTIALLFALAAGFALSPAAAQDASRTQALAKELADLLQQQKLDAMATRLGEDQFAAVLFIPGVQMLVVSARYAAPVLLNERILNKQYREAYLDLASASIPESKLFIEDMQANGLRPQREGDEPFDIVSKGTDPAFTLDGDHRKKKISEEEYRKTYAEFESEYEKILTALVAEGRKSS